MTAIATTARRQGLGSVPALDGIRAIAVLTVMFYRVGQSWIPGDDRGADIFFVLSGFLITAQLLEVQS